MSASKATNIQPKRILVITQRYLGDTLLITPLLGSLKKAYPHAKIDVLLPTANTGVLEGNPDVNQCITFPKKRGVLSFLRLLLSLFQHYDLAISAQTSDRTTLCAIVAGKIKLGFVDEEHRKSWWKKKLLSQSLVFSDNYSHAVLENLRFCDLLNIPRHYKLTPPNSLSIDENLPQNINPYAVLHIMPQWRYKQWHIQGWRELIEFLHKKNYLIVLTGSNNPNEIQILNQLQSEYPDIINTAGHLKLASLTKLISNAIFFIGPDTGITHLAAATGIPTIAIFGPTDPKKWAPWPYEYSNSKPPFSSTGSQSTGNVYLIQGKTNQNCIPCQGEGCEKHRNSYSQCLDQLDVAEVIDLIEKTITLN
jgi:heptosyltransferase-3